MNGEGRRIQMGQKWLLTLRSGALGRNHFKVKCLYLQNANIKMFILKMQISKCLPSKCKYQNVYLQNANIKMFIFKMQISNFRCCKKISNLKTILSRVLRKQLLDHSTPTSFNFLREKKFSLGLKCSFRCLAIYHPIRFVT